jgi:hypothetical protein
MNYLTNENEQKLIVKIKNSDFDGGDKFTVDEEYFMVIPEKFRGNDNRLILLYGSLRDDYIVYEHYYKEIDKFNKNFEVLCSYMKGGSKRKPKKGKKSRKARKSNRRR